MDIDKLILTSLTLSQPTCFGSLMDIDKLIRTMTARCLLSGFGSLMDMDKLIPADGEAMAAAVLVL